MKKSYGMTKVDDPRQLLPVQSKPDEAWHFNVFKTIIVKILSESEILSHACCDCLFHTDVSMMFIQHVCSHSALVDDYISACQQVLANWHFAPKNTETDVYILQIYGQKFKDWTN